MKAVLTSAHKFHDDIKERIASDMRLLTTVPKMKNLRKKSICAMLLSDLTLL